MNYSEAISWLYGTQLFGIKLGLENMQRLLGELGNPQDRLRFIHVAGTNGKGSTCAFLDAICRAAGLKTGLFTSPHLVSFAERIQVAGQKIPEPEIAARLTDVRQRIQDWEPHPTFFEITTALALSYFADQRCDIVILEVGMGGRLDATNVVTPMVSVITPISFDHEAWLGNTLTAIAGEKAGIIKPGVPVVSAPQAPEAAEVIARRSAELGSPCVTVAKPWTASPVSLPGLHQRWNAAVAAETALLLGSVDGRKLHEPCIVQGLAAAVWPARFQRWSDRLVIDGAHNPAGAEVLVQAWCEMFGAVRPTIIFGAVASKDLNGVLSALGKIAAEFLVVEVASVRALPTEVMVRQIRETCPKASVASMESLAAALEHVIQANRPALVTGSLYLCGQALALLGEENFESSSQ